MKSFLLRAVGLLWFTGLATHAADPIGDAFFPPELIMKVQEQLGLTVDQKSTFEIAFLEFQQALQPFQQEIQQESAKLATLASATRVDEKAAVAQADRISDVERRMKHAQLSLLVLIKNTLTSEQQAKVHEIKGKIAAIAAKSNQVKVAADRWKAEKRDLTQFGDLKNEIDALNREGKFGEVEAVLDRALQTLNSKDAK